MSDLIVLGASALGVLAMIGAAALLGFRKRAFVDEPMLAQLSAAEGARIEANVADGAAGVARLDDGRWLVARAMADGVGARVFASNAVRVRAVRGGIALRFDDIGYPALRLKLSAPAPAWLAEKVT